MKPGMRWLAISLIAMALSSSGAWSSTEGAGRGELSPAEKAALLEMSTKRPCAVVALLRVLGDLSRQTEGDFYVDRMPLPEEIESAIRLTGNDRANILEGILRRNPYADPAMLVHVRWWLAPSEHGTYAFTVHAQFAPAPRATAQHPSLVEPVAVVLLSRQGFRLAATE